MQNLLSKTPYKFKKSYGGTPEPQTPQDAPSLHGPSLKIVRYLAEEFNPRVFVVKCSVCFWVCGFLLISNFGSTPGTKLLVLVLI